MTDAPARAAAIEAAATWAWDVLSVHKEQWTLIVLPVGCDAAVIVTPYGDGPAQIH